MKWLTAAEGPVNDWIHVTVDGIAYCVHSKRAEIHFESKDPADLSVLLNSDRHRRLLADTASLRQRESGDWASDRQASWKVSYGGKSLMMNHDGVISSGKREASDTINIEVGDINAEKGAKVSIKPREKSKHDKHDMGDKNDSLGVSAKVSPNAREWISKKIKKLRDEGKNPDQAAGEAYNMAREKGYEVPKSKASLEVTAESIEEMAQRKFNKDYSNCSPEEKSQILDEMKNQESQSPEASPVPPSFTAPTAPLAPGQASKTISWFVAADNPDFKEEGPDAENQKDRDEDDDEPVKKDDTKTPPFENKDDSKKDDKAKEKSDKKEKKDKPAKEPKEKKDKSDGKPGDKKYEEKDVEMAEDLLEQLEELIEREEKEGEGGPHLEALKHALEELKKFLGEEEHELDMAPENGPGIPMKIDMKPMPIGPKDKGPMPPSISGPTSGPVSGPPPMPFASWTEENKTGFNEGDSVWRKADMGIVNSVGLEPGRVVAIGNGKVIVDWGDDDGVPTEEKPSDIVMAQEASGERALFAAAGSMNPEVSEEDPEQTEAEFKAQVESVLASTSLKDLLKTSSPDGSNPNAIVHLGTGMEGEYVAKGSDGRLLIKVAGEEFFVWASEIRFVNKLEEN